MVNQYYAAYNRRDIPELLDLFDEDVVYHDMAVYDEPFVGKDELAAYFEKIEKVRYDLSPALSRSLFLSFSPSPLLSFSPSHSRLAFEARAGGHPLRGGRHHWCRQEEGRRHLARGT